MKPTSDPNSLRMCQNNAMLYDIFIAVSACLITAFVNKRDERCERDEIYV